VLDNLQDNTEDLHQLVLVDTAKRVKNINSCISKFCKNKVTVVGDSHARGWAGESSHHLSKSFEVKGTVMPGSRLEKITLLANSGIKHLCKDDFVIVHGGANDINKNESSICLKHLRKFVLRNSHTNVFVATGGIYRKHLT
jgi:hypothetical protein